jgi:hypothetical protein
MDLQRRGDDVMSSAPDHLCERWVQRVPWVREVLVYSFDFELLPTPRPVTDLELDGHDCYEVARTALGGRYIHCSPHPQPQTAKPGGSFWMYAGPDGRAGIVARSEEQLLRLVVTLPYWLEVLDQAGENSLDALRRAATTVEHDVLNDMPDLLDVRDQLLKDLGLRHADALEGLLQACCSFAAARPRTAQGDSFAPLLGS